MAVECDGASYHSALWARERDRLRQAILENLGWRFHRIWSTDWFHDRAQQIERLRAALDLARLDAADGIVVRGSNEPTASGADMPEDGDVSSEDQDSGTTAGRMPDLDDMSHLAIAAPAYKRARLQSDLDMPPQDAPPQAIRDLVRQIVEIEGPIHEEEIARRLASAFGLSRAGSRIVETCRRAIRSTTGPGSALVRLDAFIMTPEQRDAPPVRDRSAESGSLLKADYLCGLEVKAAADLLVKECGSLTPDDMRKAVARLFGYQRTGPDLAKRLTALLFDDEGQN